MFNSTCMKISGKPLNADGFYDLILIKIVVKVIHH